MTHKTFSSSSVSCSTAAPILPILGQRNVLVTSALPYVNNVPHLGNIIGCVLSADVYARFCRLRGYNVIYVCGTDEYGTATEQKAIQEGMTPRQICDKYHAIHADVYKWFDIQFDVFGRTSTPAQTEIVQGVFHECEAAGIIHEDVVEQLYCEQCAKFLADRYVGGTCPECGYVGAHGDQCDGCGHLMNAILLKDAYCVADRSRPIIKSSQHLFIDLPKCQAPLTEWIDKQSVDGHWSANSIQVTRGWLATGLKSRSITRDLKWGIPVPKDGYRDKVFYVWFDAPIGYLSITAAYTPDWHLWWKNPNRDMQIELVQFMGKDNIPFHTVIFPSMLMGADQGYTMLHHISTTEYLNYETGKFSKSRGVGVFGDTAKLTGVSSSVWRYYLLVNRPENSDTVFTWDDFQQKNNGELLKNLGNFINRALVFVLKFFGGVVPTMHALTPEDDAFIADMNEKAVQYCHDLDLVCIKDALKTAMAACSRCNLYFQDMEPWKLHKLGDVERASTIVALGISAVLLLSALIEPYMPRLTDTILEQLNVNRDVLSLKGGADGQSFFNTDAIPAGHAIGTPQVLFTKITDEQIAAWRLAYGGQQQQQQKPPAAAAQ